MTINLTDNQKNLLKWLAKETRRRNLEEHFQITWVGKIWSANPRGEISKQHYKKGISQQPIPIYKLDITFLDKEGFLQTEPNYRNPSMTMPIGSVMNALASGYPIDSEIEVSRDCKLNQKAIDAVTSKFKSPEGNNNSRFDKIIWLIVIPIAIGLVVAVLNLLIEYGFFQ